MKKLASLINFNYIAYFLIIVFVIVFVILSFGRHDALKSYGNDLGFYNQAVWNTAYGHFFQYSSGMNNETNLLTTRFSLILLFFVPFYWIIATPKWLLLFQALSVGASAIPVYLIAKDKLKSEKLGLVFLLSYLFYPVLHNGLLYDFHEVVFAVAFAAWAFYFMEKKNDKGFIICCILIALSQEYLALIVIMLGLYQAYVKKRWKFGLIVSVTAIFYFVFLTGYLMPQISKAGEHGMLSNKKFSYYGWLGSSLPEIVKTLVTRPGYIYENLATFSRAQYLFHLVLPVFSLGAFSWPVVITFPILALYFLSMTPMTYTIYFYHGVILAPFIYFSAIYTFERWFEGNNFLRYSFAGLVIIFSVGSAMVLGLSPLGIYNKTSDYVSTDHARLISQIEKMIPGSASLSAQHNLSPHFSGREKIYAFPVMRESADYILVDTFDPYADNGHQLTSFGYAIQMDINEWKAEIEKVNEDKNYEKIYDNDGWLLFERIK